MALAIGGGITFGGGISISPEAGVPTDPFFSDVTLLLHGDGAYAGSADGQQNNTFLDSSTNAYTVTRSGNTTQGTFSPFSRSSGNLVSPPYDAAVHGGSGYFDGSADFLGLPDEVGQIGTSDVTFEAWVWVLDSSGGSIFAAVNSNSSNPSIAFQVQTTTNLLRLRCGTSSNNIVSTNPVPLNQWVHVAGVRQSGALKLFINGELDPSSYSASASNISSTVYVDVGQTETAGGGGSYFSGYISDFRITNSALYTSSFSVPTEPLTAGGSTRFLLNFTNAGIYDNSGKNVLETQGNAQVDTTVKKFGTGSMEFDGTGDFLIVPNTATNTLGSEDFTIEGWFYKTADTVGSGAQNIIWWNGNPAANSQAAVRVLVNNNETMALLVSESGSAWQINTTTASAIVTLNTWTHFAVVRSGATITLYVGGTSRLSGSLTSSGVSLYSGSLNYIGNMLFSSGSHFWIGNLDDIRITKGVARYTEDFTPPTEAFPDQ